MPNTQQMRLPEFLVFVRSHLLGVLLAEIFRIGFGGSKAFGEALVAQYDHFFPLMGVAGCLALVTIYAYRRRTFPLAVRIIASRRVDLLLLFVLGLWVNHLIAPKLTTFHDAVADVDKLWAVTVLGGLLALLISPLLRELFTQSKGDPAQLTFLADVEIENSGADALEIADQAQQFAETVLASAANPGLVFGVDAPWGIGKTSFLNLAEKRWNLDKSVIVIKFQPLRYASESDLAERFVRDLCSGIQQQVFAPEFAPAATRYSRMLKGKTNLSFLGMQLTLEPSGETMDELLEDIDNVLKQLQRRLIVIIDDLDRLDPKLVNNVLFTVRRTFKLSRATYILCYDTEMLVAGKDEGGRAREFLEKFITVKLSLFVDGGTIAQFLQTDWTRDSERFQTIPADTMDKLSAIMAEVAKMVSGPLAHSYAPLLGDLRKVKRLVNAMLLMQIEQTDFGRSDFHYQDLLHLILLHLHYPGLFRRIYVEETGKRTGSFSVCRSERSDTANLQNAEGLQRVLDASDAPAKFLLGRLFDVDVLGFSRFNQPDEGVMRSRACFNGESRNLENYLRLIVRFKAPLPTETFKVYKDTVDAIVDRQKSIDEVLSLDEFSLRRGEKVQEQLWRILVNNAYRLDAVSANQAINKLIACLPSFSSNERGDRSLRQRSIYSLALLLDRAGFGELRGERSREIANVVEIAERILGKQDKFPESIIEQLIAPPRGVLGWNDLMLFRLTCSIDRRGQVHNVYTALLRHEDPMANVSGDVSSLALRSLRRLSQEIFTQFRRDYIDAGRNFFIEVNGLTDAEIFGEAGPQDQSETSNGISATDAVRSAIKSFVIYQLMNDIRSGGSGVGCGVYDEFGLSDRGGIKVAMLAYVLDSCFNPLVDERNAFEFADFCLRARHDSLFESFDGQLPEVYESALTKLFPRERLQAFWVEHGSVIKRQLEDIDRTVTTQNNTSTYAQGLPIVFEVLDKWLNEPIAEPVAGTSFETEVSTEGN